MVQILCPHCEEEIELDDDASGEFACPYCEGEFEWNTEQPTEGDFFVQEEGASGITRNHVALGLAVFGILAGLLAVSMFTGAMGGFADCPEEFREPAEMIDGEEGYSCNQEYDANTGDSLGGILTACFVVFPISAVLIWVSYTLWVPSPVFVQGDDEEGQSQTLATSIINGTFNVGVTGVVTTIGLVLLAIGSFGLYKGIPFLFELLDSDGSSGGAIALLFIIPGMLLILLFCALMVFIGLKYLITVLLKNIRR